MKLLVAIALGLAAAAAAQSSRPAAGTASSPSALADSMERKLQRLQSNGRRVKPDQAPTVFSEQEVNAYFAAGRVRLPKGVKSARFSGQPGVVTGIARVDFDEITAGRRTSNPLLAVFSGVHHVAILAHAYGAGGQGYVHIDSVALDDISIPRFVLQIFVDHYIHPKYPNLGLDSRFALPARVDAATVGLHQLSVTQK